MKGQGNLSKIHVPGIAATILLAFAGLLIAPATTLADPVTFNINSTYTLPGGLIETGSAVAQFDQTTGEGSGKVTFSEPPEVSHPLIQIPAFMWVILHFPNAAPGGVSLQDLSNSEFTANMVTNFGLAGTALYTVTVNGSEVTIIGDLSGIDQSALPSLSNSLDLRSEELVVSAGPGAATGFGTLSAVGFGQLATDTVYYDFTGNPTAQLANPVLLTYNAGYMQVGPTMFMFGGQSSATEVPEPTTILLLATGLAGIAAGVRKQRRDKRVK